MKFAALAVSISLIVYGVRTLAMLAAPAIVHNYKSATGWRKRGWFLGVTVLAFANAPLRATLAWMQLLYSVGGELLVAFTPLIVLCALFVYSQTAGFHLFFRNDAVKSDVDRVIETAVLLLVPFTPVWLEHRLVKPASR